VEVVDAFDDVDSAPPDGASAPDEPDEPDASVDDVAGLTVESLPSAEVEVVVREALPPDSLSRRESFR
jgi:hypothetical protein